MPFEMLPVLDAMRALYEQPRGRNRFQQYLKLLEGETATGLRVPVMHFNPMAKEGLVEKLRELQQLDAEAVVAAAVQELNLMPAGRGEEPLFRVALNLADDLHGGWTNRYTTDYANTFVLSALLKRGFCTPVCWASESYNPELIRLRTLAQGWRTRYQLWHAQPCAVAEHVAQESFVAAQLPAQLPPPEPVRRELLARYQAVQHATDQPTLLTFFYGDEAARELGYREWGDWPAQAGFRVARLLAAR